MTVTAIALSILINLISKRKQFLGQLDQLEIRNYRKGFTLIELLVSIAIIGIMAAMVGPGISKAKQDQELTQASEVIKSKLIEAQSLALSPPKDNGGYEYYGLELTTSGSNTTTYQIVRKSDGPPVKDKTDYTATAQGTLSNITIDPSSTTVWFKIGNSVTVSNDSGVSGNLTIQVSNGTDTKNVIVNQQTGAIGDN